MKWLERDWMPEHAALAWPFYDWLRDRHLAAVDKLEAAVSERAAVAGRHASEDQTVRETAGERISGQRARIEAALAAGEEPPAEEPVDEVEPPTGPIRRQAELDFADAQIRAATVAVHQAAAEVLLTLPPFMYELDDALAETTERLGAAYRERREAEVAAERALRERFQRDQNPAGTTNRLGGDIVRCDCCSLRVDWLTNPVVFGGTNQHQSLRSERRSLRRWLLGTPLNLSDSLRLHQMRERVGLRRRRGEQISAFDGRLLDERDWELFEPPFAFEQALRGIAGALSDGPPVPAPALVEDRPDGAPRYDQVLALEPKERERVFAARTERRAELGVAA